MFEVAPRIFWKAGKLAGLQGAVAGRHRIPKVTKGLVVDHRSFVRAKYRATN